MERLPLGPNGFSAARATLYTPLWMSSNDCWYCPPDTPVSCTVSLRTVPSSPVSVSVYVRGTCSSPTGTSDPLQEISRELADVYVTLRPSGGLGGPVLGVHVRKLATLHDAHTCMYT